MSVDSKIYRSRITEGGSGGTVVVLTGSDADVAVRLVDSQYAYKTAWADMYLATLALALSPIAYLLITFDS